MDEGSFDESMMFNEYHQKPGGSPPVHHQHQPLLAFQQPGDMMGYALPDHMDMHHHHQLQDMDMHRHHHIGPDQMQDRQIQMAGGDPQDLFQIPVTTSGAAQPVDIVNANGGVQKHIKLEMDTISLPNAGPQSGE